jgi:hypothetical protein
MRRPHGKLRELLQQSLLMHWRKQRLCLTFGTLPLIVLWLLPKLTGPSNRTLCNSSALREVLKPAYENDILCNYFVNGMANITLMTHAMSFMAKSVTPLTIVELHKFLNRLVVDSPHIERDDQ